VTSRHAHSQTCQWQRTACGAGGHVGCHTIRLHSRKRSRAEKEVDERCYLRLEDVAVPECPPYCLMADSTLSRQVSQATRLAALRQVRPQSSRQFAPPDCVEECRCLNRIEPICDILHETPTPLGVANSSFLLTSGLYPVVVRIPSRVHHRIPLKHWPELVEQYASSSIRSVARQYGVSHEAVRRTLEIARAPGVHSGRSEAQARLGD
jgi:hypothetical protein